MTRLPQHIRECMDYYGTPLDSEPASWSHKPAPFAHVKLALVDNAPVVSATCTCGYKGEQRKTVEQAKADVERHRRTHGGGK
jgi:hypothetical protein